jgi:hypothetical protein
VSTLPHVSGRNVAQALLKIGYAKDIAINKAKALIELLKTNGRCLSHKTKR